MKKIYTALSVLFFCLLLCVSNAAAVQMATTATYDSVTDADTGTQGTVSSSVEEESMNRMVSVKAVTSAQGLGAVESSYFAASGTEDLATSEASATWSNTYTSSSDTKAYTFYLSIPAFTLGIDDNCFCGISDQVNPHMISHYEIEVLLDDVSIWSSSATLEGGQAGHHLTESGTDFGGTYQGSSTSFHYTFGPYSTVLDLGTFSAGDTFSVEVRIRGTSQELNWETNAPFHIGSPSSLSPDDAVSFGLGAPQISVSPAAISFDTTTVDASSPPQTVTITNTGQETLTVLDMNLSDSNNYSLDLSPAADGCGCANPTLAPGQSCNVAVTFTPRETGTLEAGLDITSNDPAHSAVTVSLSGQGDAPYPRWAKLYGRSYGDAATALVQTSGGKFLVTGFTDLSSSGRPDAWLLDLNADGSVAWQEMIGGNRDDRAWALAATDDDGFMMAGETNSAGSGGLDAWIVKLDASGNKVWEKTYGDEQDQSVRFLVRTPAGDFIAGGNTPWIMKIDADGIVEWNRKFDGVRLGSLQATDSGGAVAYLHTHQDGSSDALFFELGPDGSILWSKMTGAIGYLLGEEGTIAKTPDGEYWIAADAGGPNVFVARLNAERQVVWQKSFTLFDYHLGLPIHLYPLADKKCLLSTTHTMMKLDSDGAVIWRRFIGANNYIPVQQTADGGYVMAGSGRLVSDLDSDLLVAITDSSGLIPGCPFIYDYSVSTDSSSLSLTEPVGFSSSPGSFTMDDTGWSHVLSTHATPATACEATPADNDSDGIPDVQEQGPDGNDPAFDGNNDGTPDGEQDEVASFHVASGGYVTLAASAGVNLEDVHTDYNPSPVGAPPDMEFEYDFFSFTLTPVPPGGSATLTIYLPDGAEPDTYYKYGPTPDNNVDHWYEFIYDGETGAEISGNIITLHFVDGRRGDDDLTEDGKITEPGGPAFMVSCHDISDFAASFGSESKNHEYNYLCDSDNDGDVDGKDLVQFSTGD